ncbi:MAG: DUF3365 domain-containing protein [Asticcacaulis sp.]
MIRKANRLSLISLTLSAGLMSSCVSTAVPTKKAAEISARSNVLADRYQSELLTALKTAMASGGPVAAITVCTEQSPAIAARLSEENNAHIQRVALRWRSPAAQPTASERQVLKSWLKAPLDPQGNPRSIVFQSGRDEVTFMRAIPLKPECQTCHGVNIQPEIKATLAESYPDDRATGFRPGELRGAFRIVWSQPETRF